MKAKDKTSSKEQSIRIEGSSGLSEADIEKMRKDAEVNAEADKKKQELIESQNQADQAIYAGEKALREYGDKVTEDIRKDVQEKIDALKAMRAGADTAAIKSGTEALSSAMSAIGPAVAKAKADEEAMSKQQQTPPPSDQEPPKQEGGTDAPGGEQK